MKVKMVMNMARIRLKLVTFLVLVGCSTLFVIVTHFHQTHSGTTGTSAISQEQRSNIRSQIASLWNKYISVQDELRQGMKQKQTQNNNPQLGHLQESSRAIQLQIDLLQQKLHERVKEHREPTDDAWTSVEDFAKRRRRVEYVCSNNQVPGYVGNVLTHKHGVIYCIVPKAGCTFWKRTFAAVKRQDNVSFTSINSISREAAHSQQSNGERYIASAHGAIYPTRLIVTRDPFSRLLSSYLDKVYLPDFWQTETSQWLRNSPNDTFSSPDDDYLRVHFNLTRSIFKGSSPTPNSVTYDDKSCGKYMTFSEFIHIGFNREEPHWMPIHTICNPCAFNVTHISSMDTFSQDARVILSKMRLDGLMDDMDQNKQIDEEISMISQYNFQHFYGNKTLPFYSLCVTHAEIAYRLWQNFRWRGYIDPDVKYKIPKFTEKSRIEEDFMAQVWAARKSGLQNPTKMKMAKKEFKRAAFASISRSMFRKLVLKYDLDFRLFGYTDARDELFLLYKNAQ